MILTFFFTQKIFFIIFRKYNFNYNRLDVNKIKYNLKNINISLCLQFIQVLSDSLFLFYNISFYLIYFLKKY